jgi:predicted NAD/FAD-dependent oxidoreductase
MAGLTAARILAETGAHPLVIDKGRAVGGRMASRRIGSARFDHGAQHFSVRSDDFSRAVDDWKRDGVVDEWFSSQSLTSPDRGIEIRHVGSGGMREIPEYLARNLDVRTGARVVRLQAVGGAIRVWGDGDAVDDATGIVLTAPPPQSLALLQGSGIGAPLGSLLEAITYDACLAVMARLDGPAGLSEGHLALGDGPVAWLSDNQHKGTSPVPAVTIHSTAAFAAARLEDDPSEWTTELVEAASEHLHGSVVQAAGHRWRFAMPRSTLDLGWIEAETDAPLLLAGEAFAGARVEGAFLSGLAAGTELARRLA